LKLKYDEPLSNFAFSVKLRPYTWASATLARAGLLGLTCLTVAGLMKLNLQGEGVTRTAKRLWKK
jgi:hypothetical protein